MSLERQIKRLNRSIEFNPNLRVRIVRVGIVPAKDVWEIYSSIDTGSTAELIAGPQTFSQTNSTEPTYLITLNRSPSPRELDFLPITFKETPISYLAPTNRERMKREILDKQRY